MFTTKQSRWPVPETVTRIADPAMDATALSALDLPLKLGLARP